LRSQGTSSLSLRFSFVHSMRFSDISPASPLLAVALAHTLLSHCPRSQSSQSATILALAHSRPISSDHRHATASGAGSHSGTGSPSKGVRTNNTSGYISLVAYPNSNTNYATINRIINICYATLAIRSKYLNGSGIFPSRVHREYRCRM